MLQRGGREQAGFWSKQFTGSIIKVHLWEETHKYMVRQERKSALRKGDAGQSRWGHASGERHQEPQTEPEEQLSGLTEWARTEGRLKKWKQSRGLHKQTLARQQAVHLHTERGSRVRERGRHCWTRPCPRSWGLLWELTYLPFADCFPRAANILRSLHSKMKSGLSPGEASWCISAFPGTLRNSQGREGIWQQRISPASVEKSEKGALELGGSRNKARAVVQLDSVNYKAAEDTKPMRSARHLDRLSVREGTIKGWKVVTYIQESQTEMS